MAVDAGSPGAMRSHAFDLLYGTYGVRNWPRAVRLLHRARLGGCPHACLDLGICYAQGIRVERNLAQAFELWHAAYDSGVPSAGLYLARCYDEGFGIEQDLTRAADIYREMAARRDWICKKNQVFYGLCLVRGRGVKQNRRLGMKVINEGLFDYCANGWAVLGDCHRFGYGN